MSHKTIMGPASQPELKIDVESFVSALEARYGDVGHDAAKVTEQGYKWYQWEARIQRNDLQISMAEDTEGAVVSFEGQGDDEDAFIFWFRSYMPKDQKLFLHAWDGACYLEITEDTTPQMLLDGYNDIPSGDVELAVNYRVWEKR
jgi:hypothetical protein